MSLLKRGGLLEVRTTVEILATLEAAERFGTFDPRPYVREYPCGNVPLTRFLSITARAAVEEPLRKLGLVPASNLSILRECWLQRV